MRVGVTGFESYLGYFLVQIGTFRLEKNLQNCGLNTLEVGPWSQESGPETMLAKASLAVMVSADATPAVSSVREGPAWERGGGVGILYLSVSKGSRVQGVRGQNAGVDVQRRD